MERIGQFFIEDNLYCYSEKTYNGSVVSQTLGGVRTDRHINKAKMIGNLLNRTFENFLRNI